MRRAAKKPLLHAEETDCIWKTYRDWTSDQWKSVVFSDESMFRPVRGTSKTIHRPSGSDRYDPKFTVKTVNHSSQVMVWGLSARKGVVGDCTSFLLMWPWGGLFMWLLWKIICSNSFDMHRCHFFMHYGALAHKIITVRECLASHNIPVLDCPGNSPDHNLIENAWQIMKNKIHAQAPMSVKELQELLKRTWVEMDQA